MRRSLLDHDTNVDGAVEQSADQLPSPAELMSANPDPNEGSVPRLELKWRWLLGSVLGLLVAGSIAYAFLRRDRAPVDLVAELWSNPRQPSASYLLCLPDISAVTKFEGTTVIREQEPAPSTLTEHLRSHDAVSLADILAAMKISALLTVYKHAYRVRLDTATDLDELRQGPVILVGGVDNIWTMRALEHLPIRFQADAQHGTVGLVDAKTGQKWELEIAKPYKAINRDYAIVGRFYDGVTGQFTVVLGGIGDNGTQAAGEFISSQEGLENLSKALQSDPAKINFEAVISAEVIEGKSGTPKIVATRRW